jgi:proton-dependent oligopeptide transporter, POT family
MRRDVKDWFGQPRGLTILFLTDTWAFFSFYGMKALLVYYMIKQLHMPQADAAIIYGLYSGFANFTPLFGGIASDRWLGRRLAVTIGGSIMAVGHFMMAFETLFYGALVTILIGHGLFTPNLPSQVDDLYAANDPRRSSAYNVYYAGINLGAFMAPLLCGTIGEFYGWHYGFAVAGFGMMLAVVIYWGGGRYLPTQIRRNEDRSFQVAPENPLITLRQRVITLAGIGLALIVLRIAYDQQGNALAVWTDQGIDRAISSTWSIPMTWFQSINPFVIFILTPWIVARWKQQATLGREWGATTKMAFGSIIIALAYLIMLAAVSLTGSQGEKASWTWLATAYVVLTVGELYILPVALGLFGRLAPEGAKASVIACYFMAAFFGNMLGGYIGTYWQKMTTSSYFMLMIAICLIAAVSFALLGQSTRKIERML